MKEKKEKDKKKRGARECRKKRKIKDGLIRALGFFNLHINCKAIPRFLMHSVFKMKLTF